MTWAITPTGGRPEAFALCERWMRRQTVSPDKWLVVSDCVPHPETATERYTLIKPDHEWWPGMNTHAQNLQCALALVPRDAPVIFIEDDDWYSPLWVQRCLEALQSCEIYGEFGRNYYNAANQTCMMRADRASKTGAAFGATAIRGERARKIVDAVLAGPLAGGRNPKLDVQIWAKARQKGLNMRLDPGAHSVSIKGLPGRPGITGAHRQRLPIADPDGSRLRALVGREEAEAIMEAARCSQ